MFESFGRSIALLRETLQVLREEKSLLVFPLVSGILLVLIIISFVAPLLFLGVLQQDLANNLVLVYGLVFLFYLLSYCIVIFFNAALVTCVHIRLSGKDPTVMDGIRNAIRHIGSIIGWSILAATIGLILQIIRDRGGIVGRIDAAFIGGAWSLVTFFVIPVIVIEDRGILPALRESWGLFKRTWGENVIGQFALGLVFILAGLLGVVCVVLALFSGSIQLFSIAVGLFLLFLAVLAVLYATLSGIYTVVLYSYARTGRIAAGFNRSAITGAFQQAPPGRTGGNI